MKEWRRKDLAIGYMKICGEITCNFVYEADRGEGRCPKCGSEGIHIKNTIIGTKRNVFIENRPEDKAGVKGLPDALTVRDIGKGELKWEE